MNRKRIFTLALAVLMVLALAACGTKPGDQTAGESGEMSTGEEAAATYKSLMDRENELLSENADLWEKVYLAADKNAAATEAGNNYGDFLLNTIEAAKEQFTDDELELLKTRPQRSATSRTR